MSRIETIVVIYPENRSFDNLYGLFPGANGIANATQEQYTQLDHDGRCCRTARVGRDGRRIRAFPELPNAPFRIDAPPVNLPPTRSLPSPIHAYYHNIEQINGGRNDMFAAMSNVGGWAMGYFDGSSMKLWQWAKEYTLADNFFMGAFGGSYLNHQYLVCACTPAIKDAPPAMRARLDADGKLEKRPGSPSAREAPCRSSAAAGGQVTPDGFSVNTTQPPYQPSGMPPADGGRRAADPKGTSPGVPLPPQTAQDDRRHALGQGCGLGLVFGRLERGPRGRPADRPTKRAVIYTRANRRPNFQPHHQPFNYFARFARARRIASCI